MRTEPILRRLVALSGGLMALAGIVAIATLPWPAPLRYTLILLWAGACARELWLIYGQWRTYTDIRLDADGRLSLYRPDGEWESATLLPDGILRQQWGWIRLRRGHGPACAELLRRGAQSERDWRRLQVIWRHVGAPV